MDIPPLGLTTGVAVTGPHQSLHYAEKQKDSHVLRERSRHVGVIICQEDQRAVSAAFIMTAVCGELHRLGHLPKERAILFCYATPATSPRQPRTLPRLRQSLLPRQAPLESGERAELVAGVVLALLGAAVVVGQATGIRLL